MTLRQQFGGGGRGKDAGGRREEDGGMLIQQGFWLYPTTPALRRLGAESELHPQGQPPPSTRASS